MPEIKQPGAICVRLPAGLRNQLEDHLQRGDLVRSRFVRAAIVEKLRRDRAIAPPASTLPQ